MNENEVKAVLEWLRDYLKWASSKIYNPTTIFKMKRDLSEHKKEIYLAFREAVRDEFSEFADIVGKTLGISEGDDEVSGGDEERVSEEDGGEDREDNGEADNVSSDGVINNG